MGRKASSNGMGKLLHQVVGLRRGFRAMAGTWEDKHADEADRANIAPGLVGKGSRHGDGAPKSVIECGPAEGYTKIQVAPKVTNRIAHQDSSVHMDPLFDPKFISSRRAGAKGVALCRGTSGTQGMQVAKGEGIGSLNLSACPGPLAETSRSSARHRGTAPRAWTPLTQGCRR